jgi:probable rRNA maturation factor
MFESDSLAGESVVEVYINTESTEDDQAASALLETLKVEEFVRHTLHSVHVEQAVTLTLVISGDDEIQRLNRQYRQQDKPTDVLSFPLLDEPLVSAPAEWLWQEPEATETAEADEAELADEEDEEDTETPFFVTPAELATNLGDIMISWPTTVRQAREAGHRIADELLFLLCHGVLHLVGYDDQTESGYHEMVRLQKQILSEVQQEGWL